MNKKDKFSPKAIANRQKSKGLQKLRWYCQLCQKQCRDENGFKCHAMSESHERQALLAGENLGRVLTDYSEQFHQGFMKLLSRRFNTRRVHSNIVYQEYIADKEHLHMNATKWVTLTEFVKYLGAQGECIVEDTPKGWFITYIDRDPDTIRRQEEIAAMEKHQYDEEERQLRVIEEQVKRDREAALARGQDFESQFTELKRENEDEKVEFKFVGGVAAKVEGAADPLKAQLAFKMALQGMAAQGSASRESADKEGEAGSKRKISALELIREKREESKLKKLNYEEQHADNWVAPDIVVRIIHKTLADGKFYRQKAVIKGVKDKYIATVECLDSRAVISIDQEYLETVLPSIGGVVRVLNGSQRSHQATLLAVDVDKYVATIKMLDGPKAGQTLSGIAYEDISKVAE